MKKLNLKENTSENKINLHTHQLENKLKNSIKEK